jgi:colanic acid/amylovoran biosynthesis glycosyltransferase
VTFPVAAWHARELRADGVDHVHAHFAHYPALAAWIAHELTGVPYSFTAHANDIFVHHGMLARKASDAGFVATISEFNRDFLRARGAVAPIRIVHCGVDPADYAFAAPAERDGRAPRVLCVAAFREPKGHEVLLRAVAEAPPRLARARVDLVGDGPLRPRLEALAAELGIADRVTFHGSLPAPAVTELLRASDVFVLPSVITAEGDMDGVPVALMEALAVGVPAVSTRVSGIPELVRDGRTGLLAEPGDPASLAAALEATLADPEAARERATAGRALVEREYDQRVSAVALAGHFAAGRPA